MQILKNLFKLAGEEYRMIPNIFAIRAEDSLILIDCGTNENDWSVAKENMAYWGIDHLPITDVLITHAHGDHAGYAAKLQEAGAKIHVGSKCRSVESANDPLNFYYAYPTEYTPFIPDHYVEDGEELSIHGITFKAIEAPGHSIGDVVYQTELDGKRILFLGDVFHIDSYGMGAWIGEQWFLDSDYDQYMRSLFKLKDLEADIILSAHMQGCLRNASGILKDAFIKAQEKFDGRWDKKKFIDELRREGRIL